MDDDYDDGMDDENEHDTDDDDNHDVDGRPCLCPECMVRRGELTEDWEPIHSTDDDDADDD